MKKIIIGLVLIATILASADDQRVSLCDYYMIDGWKNIVSETKNIDENATRSIVNKLLKYEDDYFHTLCKKDMDVLKGCSFRKWLIFKNLLK